MEPLSFDPYNSPWPLRSNLFVLGVMADKPTDLTTQHAAEPTTQHPPQETSTEPNVSLLYVKRKRSAPAPTASLYVEVEAKRQRVFNEFKLVTSTSSEPRKLDRSELYRRYKHEETSISDIRGRCRTEGDERRRAAKYNIISTHRGEQGDVLAAEEEEGSEHDDLCQRLINNKLTHDVTDNMPHPYTFLEGGEEDWVYDVYLCEGAMRGQGIGISDNNWELDDDHEVVRERYVGDYDEDSNDENHWANEYPDEGDDSDSDYNGGFGGEDSDSELLQNRRCSNDYYDGSDIMWKSDKYLRSDTKLNFLVYKYLSQPQFATARDAFRQALLGEDRALPDASILGDHSPEQNIQYLEEQLSHITPDHMTQVLGAALNAVQKGPAPGFNSILGHSSYSLPSLLSSLDKPVPPVHVKPKRNIMLHLSDRSIGRNKVAQAIATQATTEPALIARIWGHLAPVYCIVTDHKGTIAVTVSDILSVNIAFP
eukprot:sb/3464259/